MILDFIIPLNFVIPIFYIYKYCYNESGFKMDHVFIISSGFIYFWMIPLTVYHYNLFSSYSFEYDFSIQFSLKNIALNNELIERYLIYIFCIYVTNKTRVAYLEVGSVSLQTNKLLPCQIKIVKCTRNMFIDSISEAHYFLHKIPNY